MKTLNKLLILIFFTTFFGLNSCKKELNNSTHLNVENKAILEKDSMVLVPGVGLMSKSKIHLIQEGHQLEKLDGHIFEVEKSTNKVITDFGMIGNQTLNNLKTNQQVNLRTSPLLNSTKAIVPVTGNPNWIIFTQWTSGQVPISNFSTTWIVPNTPYSNNGQVLFIFNGLEDNSMYNILQPVLQYGGSAAGGGNYWAIANWYVTQTFVAVQLPLITVNPGTSLQGIMTLTGTQAGTGSYNYTSSFSGYSNSLTVVDGIKFQEQKTVFIRQFRR